MPLGTRILKVTISLDSGDVVLDQSLDLHVRVSKLALAMQTACSIDVFNLSQNLRERLLSQFTAWNKRNVEHGTAGYTASYVNVKVDAGYLNASQSSTSTIFTGQVVVASPFGAPPNQGVRIECYSRQIDRTQNISDPAPTSGSFKSYVLWAAAQMGIDNVVCETSYNDTNITNPFASTIEVSALIWDIQNAYRPNVAAFIDNNTLYVRDANKLVSSAQIVKVSEFIGMPIWNEWGAEFTTLFDQRIVFPHAVALQSDMNPSLGQGSFVLTEIEYDLSSRQTEFYVKASGSPPA